MLHLGLLPLREGLESLGPLLVLPASKDGRVACDEVGLHLGLLHPRKTD